MEESTFQKDETPYVVFACSKCSQFSYVKTTQKTKKCLRCGRMHQVKNVLTLGEIVLGMTQAVHTVKEKQNELARKKIGGEPNFRAKDDFSINANLEFKRESESFKPSFNGEKDYIHMFERLLRELSLTYSSFPKYIIEILADNYGIPQSELKELIRQFKRRGILQVRENRDYYSTKFDLK